MGLDLSFEGYQNWFEDEHVVEQSFAVEQFESLGYFGHWLRWAGIDIVDEDVLEEESEDLVVEFGELVSNVFKDYSFFMVIALQEFFPEIVEVEMFLFCT